MKTRLSDLTRVQRAGCTLMSFAVAAGFGTGALVAQFPEGRGDWINLGATTIGAVLTIIVAYSATQLSKNEDRREIRVIFNDLLQDLAVAIVEVKHPPKIGLLDPKYVFFTKMEMYNEMVTQAREARSWFRAEERGMMRVYRHIGGLQILNTEFVRAMLDAGDDREVHNYVRRTTNAAALRVHQGITELSQLDLSLGGAGFYHPIDFQLVAERALADNHAATPPT